MFTNKSNPRKHSSFDISYSFKDETKKNLQILVESVHIDLLMTFENFTYPAKKVV